MNDAPDRLQTSVNENAVDIMRGIEPYMFSFADRNDLGPLSLRSIEMNVNGKPWEATIRYVYARGTVVFQRGEYRVEKAG